MLLILPISSTESKKAKKKAEKAEKKAKAKVNWLITLSSSFFCVLYVCVCKKIEK